MNGTLGAQGVNDCEGFIEFPAVGVVRERLQVDELIWVVEGSAVVGEVDPQESPTLTGKNVADHVPSAPILVSFVAVQKQHRSSGILAQGDMPVPVQGSIASSFQLKRQMLDVH